MIPSGRAKLAGVMGWPVAHSLSPRLHGYWLDKYAIDGAYVPLPVEPEDFPGAVRALAKLGFRGVNLTIPHKEAALGLCDVLDPAAQRMGSVNTLVFSPGRIGGRNTDGFGFRESLRQSAPAWDPETAPAVILGAGGAARAVIVSLLDAGVGEVRLCNRTPARAEALAAELGGPVVCVAWNDRAPALSGAGILVNTTSLGMTGQAALDLALDDLPVTALVADIVYTPLETDLLRRARARGHGAIDGLGMLLHQARPGFQAWFGVEPEVTPELRAFVLNPV